MKSHERNGDDTAPLDLAVLRVMHAALGSTESLRVMADASRVRRLRAGHHCHETWELFCPLQEELLFEVAGLAPERFPPGSLVVVPPNCLHMTVTGLEQPPSLELVAMSLPGEQGGYGSIRLVGTPEPTYVVLSAAELDQWRELLGADPAAVMERAAQGVEAGGWGKERALAHVRLLFSSFAEIAASHRSKCNRGRQCVTKALATLQTRYFDPELSVDAVACRVGLSPSHFAAVFREATGQTMHQMLIDIRMRRATELLLRTEYSIKEIAALTGWRSQLYFSAAYRRRFGYPPSAVRSMSRGAEHASPAGHAVRTDV